MKSYSIIFVVLLFFYSCRMSQIQNDLQVDTKLVNIDTISKILHVKLVLSNNSNKEVGYWENNCSWQDNWKPVDSNFYLVVDNCDGNFPVIKTIFPNDSIVHFLKIIYINNFQGKELDLFFNFIDSNIKLDSVLKIYENKDFNLASFKVVTINW